VEVEVLYGQIDELLDLRIDEFEKQQPILKFDNA
jgi:hypothetical protein